MIINQITQSDFTGNQVIRDSFTYQAAIKLYNFYEELSDDQGEPINFDPVAFRCEWCEYGDLDELMNDFDHLLDENHDPENFIEALENETRIIPVGTGYLVREF